MVQKIAAALFRPPTACVHCLLKEENFLESNCELFEHFLESYCELFAFSPLGASSLKIAGARCCKCHNGDDTRREASDQPAWLDLFI